MFLFDNYFCVDIYNIKVCKSYLDWSLGFGVFGVEFILGFFVRGIGMYVDVGTNVSSFRGYGCDCVCIGGLGFYVIDEDRLREIGLLF